MILICYDGSPDSQSAIEHAGELLSDQPATVLTVWEPFIEVVTRTTYGFGTFAGSIDVEEIDAANQKSFDARAKERAELAGKAGLKAQARTRSQLITIANTILTEAETVSATAIVMGSRGLTSVKSVLLGSVSRGVIQHADRAVVVVPSPEVSASRNRSRRAAEGRTNN